ncbi:NAD-binding protein [Gordonia pseudamarae]|jgi:3-hydroxyisobutyrate dehydrogenase-like beta-hydroxyacid dehydrogenase|uniref:NAD-binding protein n=1 Tax=Gordonia pseudamarae TaxID=2831662 RepID=A0ABX6IFZ3_9ACTN|nr:MULTISPECIES: NAD(P)-dependent oxidoreductase [Gordonia]MBD0021667.1 NAD(P)-dependent oxidoreductase [Gordonia sp. (in: high G+C Gram-positive bacteria)]QHN25349.1 NAD-binding protein [Gordonia pseudamarae]QHN34281.1 NAD-binding protein [Gordonia pseudamarae]
MSRIGLIGAGRMGLPIARILVGAGHEVTGWARSEESRNRLREVGARPASDIGDLVRAGTDVILVVVLTDDQVREVCLTGPLPEQIAPGTTLVIHTTGSPRTTQDIAAFLHPRDVTVIDAAVSGGPHNIAAGDLTLFVGGPPGVLASISPILSAYADPIIHAGAAGAGQCVKLVNNALFTAQIGAVRAAVELGEQLGIDESALLSALPHASSDSRALAGAARRGSVGAFVDSIAEFVGKDITTVRAVADGLGADLGVLDPLIAYGLNPPTGPDVAAGRCARSDGGARAAADGRRPDD